MEETHYCPDYCFYFFEFIEHVVFPLVTLFIKRKKKSAYGRTNLLGGTGEVKKWEKNEGYFLSMGNSGKREPPIFLSRDRVLVQKVEGLTLRVVAL